MIIKTPTINLFGGPSAGKSTVATGVFSLLKQHGVSCELVTEFAKDLTWENRFKTMTNQRYIFGKQYHRQWRIRDQVKVIITDSPLLLSLHYQPEHYKVSFTKEVLEAWNEFTNVNFFVNRIKEYDTKGRTQNELEAKEIDYSLRTTLRLVNEPFEDISGDYIGINTVTSKIIKQFDKVLNFRFTGSKNG